MSTRRNLELIHWVDSHSAGGAWLEPERVADEMPLSRILTLGWVVFEDADRLIVSSSHEQDWKLAGEVLCIVKVAITERRRVTVGEPQPGELVGRVDLKAVGE